MINIGKTYQNLILDTLPCNILILCEYGAVSATAISRCKTDDHPLPSQTESDMSWIFLLAFISLFQNIWQVLQCNIL